MKDLDKKIQECREQMAMTVSLLASVGNRLPTSNAKHVQIVAGVCSGLINQSQILQDCYDKMLAAQKEKART